MKYKKCTQSECHLLKDKMECPACAECGAGPHELDAKDVCTNCWCCYGDEGYIRNGVSMRQIQDHKIILKKSKEKLERDSMVPVEKNEKPIIL